MHKTDLKDKFDPVDSNNHPVSNERLGGK